MDEEGGLGRETGEVSQSPSAVRSFVSDPKVGSWSKGSGSNDATQTTTPVRIGHDTINTGNPSRVNRERKKKKERKREKLMMMGE